MAKVALLHITRDFYSIKLICRNLYALFSQVKKHIQPIRMACSCFTCGSLTNRRWCKGLFFTIVHRLHSNSFSDLAPFFSGVSSKMAKADESSSFVSVGCSLDEFVLPQEIQSKNTLSKTQRCLFAQKFFCSALYFLEVHEVQNLSLLLNLHLALLFMSFCF